MRSRQLGALVRSDYRATPFEYSEHIFAPAHSTLAQRVQLSHVAAPMI